MHFTNAEVKTGIVIDLIEVVSAESAGKDRHLDIQPSPSNVSSSPRSSGSDGEANRLGEEFKSRLEAGSSDGPARPAQTRQAFPFGRLPPELRTNIIEQAVSHAVDIEDRGVANSAIQALRHSGYEVKTFVDYTPGPLRERIDALKRNPGQPSRSSAAYADYENGRLPREAARVNGFRDKTGVDTLVIWGADHAFESDQTVRAKSIIDRFEVTEPDDIESLKTSGFNRDFDNGKRALEAVKDNEIDDPPLKDQMLLRGATRDFDDGLSPPEAIRRNEERGVHEMSDESRDHLRRQGAERDISLGVISRQDAVDFNGVTNPAHRRELLGNED